MQMYTYRIVVHDYHDDRETRRIYGAKYRSFNSDLPLDEFAAWYADKFGRTLHIPRKDERFARLPYIDAVADGDKIYQVIDESQD